MGWRLRPGHASRAVFAAPLAAFAIAVTQRLNGVPFVPATCFLLSPWHSLPYAFALVAAGALEPGVAVAVPGVLAGLWPWPGLGGGPAATATGASTSSAVTMAAA